MPSTAPSPVPLPADVEFLSRDAIEALQLEGLRFTVGQAFKTPFYGERLNKIGLRAPADIRSLSDAAKIPFTTKDDLRSGYPDGFLAVPKTEVLRVHASSGTTGHPTVIHHTRADLDEWTGLCARSILSTGAGPADVLQNMMTYGLFTGGLGLHYGAEAVGMMVIPAGPGNTQRQIQLMRDFGVTVAHATPSYLLHLHAELARESPAGPRLLLRKAFIGAEPHSEQIRRRIEALFGIDAYNSYGMSEMNGPGVAFECRAKAGMHLWEDAYLMELIHPGTLAPLSEGDEGELVLTTLRRQATPLLRYRTRDLTRIHGGTCACGRTHRRIARIKGRSDDMLIINGINVFPAQIETLLMRIPEFGSNYQIRVDKAESLDRLTVMTEITPRRFTGELHDLEALKARLRNEIKSACLLNAKIEIHEPGSLPVSQGKAIRVVDNRKAE